MRILGWLGGSAGWGRCKGSPTICEVESRFRDFYAEAEVLCSYRYAPERIPYAIDRYLNETKRLYSVLDDRLSGKRENGFALGTDGKSADDAAKGEEREYLVGAGKGKYSFVDISLWPWVRSHAWAGVQTLDAYPHLKRWFDAIAQRPAVKRGVDVPEKSKYNPNATPEEQDKIAAEARKWILGGK